MHARPDPAGSGRLICATRYTRHACDQPSTGMAPIEEAAVLFLARYAPPLQLARFVAEQLAGERRDGRRERAALEQRLRRLRELYLWGDLGADEYRAKRRDLEMQLAGLGASAPDRRTTEQLIRYLRDLAAGYRDAEDRERNELLRVVFRAIEVEASAVTTVELRPPFDGILAAAMVDTFGSSGTAETVPLATPLGGGRFAIPPLPIARHQREKIPAAAWPVILEAYRSGQRAPELAAIYGVVESTIWKVLRKARAAEDAV